MTKAASFLETPYIHCILHNRCSSLGVTNMWMSILDNVLRVLFDGDVEVRRNMTIDELKAVTGKPMSYILDNR